MSQQVVRERRTFLSSGKLRTLATDLSVKAPENAHKSAHVLFAFNAEHLLRQALDELEDVCISAGLLNLLLGHLRLGFNSAQQNVETDSACIECRLLRHKSHVLAVFLDIELRNTLAIKLNNYLSISFR